MYPNLRAELARKNMSMSQLSEKTGIPLQRLSKKMNGNDVRGFLYTETVSIKKALELDMSLEELSSKAV